jgi:hypothetical protein
MSSYQNVKESFNLDQSDYHEQEPAGNFVKPLSTKFYNNLLRLEEKVQRKKFTIDTINELIPLYAVRNSIIQNEKKKNYNLLSLQKCVEYYDSVKDPIKYYFLEKIQNTLANRETLKLLLKSKEEEDKIEENGGQDGNEEDFDVLSPSDDDLVFSEVVGDSASNQKRLSEYKKLRVRKKLFYNILNDV